MNETDAVVEAKRDVYRTVSLVVLIIALLVLAAVGVVVPTFYLPEQVRMYRDMDLALPTITRHILFLNPTLLLLSSGLLGTALIVKEIMAPPKARFWVNVVTLLLLLIWGACYVYAISLPMWMPITVVP